MKTTAIIAATLLLAPAGSLTGAEPLGTAFTYQGHLTDGGQSAHGAYDFRFAIYDLASGGTPLAGPVTNSPVDVSNGLFTVTLDFGRGVFGGEARWLEIGVRTNASPDDFTVLVPRQPLTPPPYALFAPTAGTAGAASVLLGTVGPHQLAGPYTNALALTHPANVLAGSFSGNGIGLSNVNAATLGGLPPAGFWQTGGNGGMVPGTHFLGTTDEQPLELRVNNATAFRLLPGHNVVGGAADNATSPGVLYATIGGGAAHTIQSNAWFAAIPGGRLNEVAGRAGFAAGHRAKALQDGAFVWADSTEADFVSTKPNQFLVRAAGGVGINTNHPQSALHVAGTVTADDFRGRGASLTDVDADRLDGRDSTDFALATHAHDAGDITNGTLADARLSANVPRLNAAQTFTAANQFPHAGNVFVGTFQGQGGALTNLDAGNVTSGTLADARLSANIPRLNAPANFTATVSAPGVQASNLIADASSLNNAALSPGLILGGASSGEGVASKRTAGGNQYGLDLFTAFNSRLAIANNGAIHIGAGNAFSTYGDARSSVYVLRGASSGASYAELFLPGSQRVTVPLNSTWTFRAFVTGRASNGEAAGYCFRGFLENESGTVRLLETINTEDYAEDDTAWDANITANDSYDALVITARGNTGDAVRWTAVIYTVEVKW